MKIIIYFCEYIQCRSGFRYFFVYICCRAPLGARGLKYRLDIDYRLVFSRAPLGARGLKYFGIDKWNYGYIGRAPLGARGLKYLKGLAGQILGCRAPLGARGLKYGITIKTFSRYKSRPTRGAWIEIIIVKYTVKKSRSRPTRGAWIEIPHKLTDEEQEWVAPHSGRVD